MLRTLILCAACSLLLLDPITGPKVALAGETNAFFGLKGSRLGGPDEVSVGVIGGIGHDEDPLALWIRYEIHDPLTSRDVMPFDGTFGAGIALYKTKRVLGHKVTLYAGPEILRPSGAPGFSETGPKAEWAGSMLVGAELAFDPGFAEVSYQWLDPLTTHEVYGDLDTILSITAGLYLGEAEKKGEEAL